MNVGTEWLVDAEGCAPGLLRDINAVRSLCEEVVADLDLRVVGEPMFHQFPEPGGVTGLYLLTESHLACHTFPEAGLATFNLYCCRPRSPFAWEERVIALLGADRVTVRTAPRGVVVASQASVVAGHRAPEEEASRDERLEVLPKAAVSDTFEIKFSEPTSVHEVSGL